MRACVGDTLRQNVLLDFAETNHMNAMLLW